MTDQAPPPTSAAEAAQAVAAAAAAADRWATWTPAQRAQALGAVADRLDAHAEELVGLAAAETHLTDGRLRGELVRTTFQLRLFGEVLADGGYLDARIDHADPAWPMGAPRPDLRRVLVPLGPVVVFAASNFPLAFSVAGGDTASALAAGCPVVVKAHSGHPRLSALTGRLVSEALADHGAPSGLLQVVFGTQAGRDVLLDPRIKAGSFTGSIPGGRALFDLAMSRPEPIPFYGELGSVNPVFVTRGAAASRPAEVVAGFVQSFTLGAGQFCTKPGLLLVPAESDLVDRLAGAQLPAAVPLLNQRIQAGYTEVLSGLLGRDEVRPLAADAAAMATPPTPSMLVTTLEAVRADPERLVVECFGPAALVVTYTDDGELVDFARSMHGQLSATIHGDQDDPVARALVPVLAGRAGRVLWNEWPTGLSVTYAQQHGGPYPATTAPTTTSVGTAAITRFLRPVAYQGFPESLLPAPLREDNPWAVPQRVSRPAAGADGGRA